MKSEGLVCPYSGCGRSFEKPVLITDCSKLPREMHYACPHCLLRLELSLEDGGEGDLGRVRVKAVDEDLLLSQLGVGDKGWGEAVSSHRAFRPSKSCRHFLGFLRGLPEGAGIPDECAVCPNIMQCFVKRE